MKANHNWTGSTWVDASIVSDMSKILKQKQITTVIMSVKLTLTLFPICLPNIVFFH